MTPGRIYETEICGVPVSSRYGIMRELREMETFVRGLIREDPRCVGAIRSVACDSKLGQINIELYDDIVPEDPSELRTWCYDLANFYYSETGESRVIVMQTETEVFEETPDFEGFYFPEGDFDMATAFEVVPPGTTLH